MLFRPTFPVNPLHAWLLDCLHPVCSCLLTCIFGVNTPTVEMQKLRPKLSWKALKHTLLPLAFLVLFPLSALTCTWNYSVCPLQSGTWFSRGMWAGQLHPGCCSCFFPFQAFDLSAVWCFLALLVGLIQCLYLLTTQPQGQGQGGLCVSLHFEQSPAWESHGWKSTVTSKQRGKCGVRGADQNGEITAFIPECLHWHPQVLPKASLQHLYITNVRRAVNSISWMSQCKVQFEIAELCFKPARPA